MTRQRSRPLIGLTLDSEGPGQYSKMPWYAIRQNYMASVVVAGGLPVAISHEDDIADAYLEELDGVVVTGGAFDVDPALFGAKARHDTVTTKDQRTKFEWDVTEGALKRDMPVFGICGGKQLMNVVLGGTLIQHIPDAVSGCLEHEQKNPRTEPGHTVAVQKNSLLHHIVQTQELPVNSAHHQAADGIGEDVIVNAVAPDGVIEGIEHPDYRFCLGVQWHPEYHISDGDRRLFDAFLKACRA
ncbi:MAG: gamma-glutamyl-gamma-aminobutyrate hydrolase [Rhodospirillaceae bacterium]|nr:gamma-glutamyl-gamma-aminobutyrate hydrolase [Rhodospirillaceae bacterium]|tara:strand:- start:928 stop:1653 length:726 start_codon:yes stop_codon:yes gene_type:complete